MNGKELAQMVSDGIHPVVTFQAGIIDQEGYLEPGMRGRLVGASDMHDDMVKLSVDLTEFDEFNRQYETNNYYDKDGVPGLTAREAGVYTGPQDYMYISNEEDAERLCVVEESSRLALHEAFRKDASGRTYMQWLEDRVLSAPSVGLGEAKKDLAASGFASHREFKLPRVPAGRYVSLQARHSGEDPARFEGLFETSGCENLGTANEIYLLRRVNAPGDPVDFIKVSRHWQEWGYLTVHKLLRDEQYSPGAK